MWPPLLGLSEPLKFSITGDLAFTQSSYHCGLPRPLLEYSLLPDWNFTNTDECKNEHQLRALENQALKSDRFSSPRTRSRTSPPTSPKSSNFQTTIPRQTDNENECQAPEASENPEGDTHNTISRYDSLDINNTRTYGPPAPMPISKPISIRNNAENNTTQSTFKLNALASVFTPPSTSVQTNRFDLARLAPEPSSSPAIFQNFLTGEPYAISIQNLSSEAYTNTFVNWPGCSNTPSYVYGSSHHDGSSHQKYYNSPTHRYGQPYYPQHHYTRPINQLLSYYSSQPYDPSYLNYLAPPPNHDPQSSIQNHYQPPPPPRTPNSITPHPQDRLGPTPSTFPSPQSTPQSTPSHPPRPMPRPKPPSITLSPATIAKALSRWYSSRSFMAICASQESRNPFPTLDMNVGWTRPRCEITQGSIHQSTEMPVLDGGGEVKLDILQQLRRFSLTRQADVIQFSEEILGMRFAKVFVGEERKGEVWKRKPGSWRLRPRFVLNEEAKLGAHMVFIEHIISLVIKIEEAVHAWEMEHVRIALAQSQLGNSAEATTVSLKRGIHLTVLSTRSGFDHDEDIIGFDELHGADSIHPHKKCKRAHVSSLRAREMTETWRERRKEQEKRAGRWMDGTWRMWRIWEEFYWVCDDDAEGQWVGLFGGKHRTAAGRLKEKKKMAKLLLRAKNKKTRNWW